jgi:hypothetical protein
MSAARGGIAGRIADLQRKIAARQGKPGFKKNTRAIRAELERLYGANGG